MATAPRGSSANASADPLVTYIAELELEVDRLRRQADYIEQTTSDVMQQVRRICIEQGQVLADSPFSIIEHACEGVSQLVRDLHEPVGRHPARDRVISIPIRALAEQIFRWRRRLSGNPGVALHLDLKTEHIDWFPGRLRNILDGLFADAIGNAGVARGESRVSLEVHRVGQCYELRVGDNGPDGERRLEPSYQHRLVRGSDEHESDMGSDLRTVALIIKQSGGSLAIVSCQGAGISRVASLPRFDTGDFLDPS